MADPVDWLAHASTFTFERDRDSFEVVRRSAHRWAVAWNGFVLHKDEMEFGYEPLPSARTQEFLSATRFRTKEAAYRALTRWWRTHERTAGSWTRKET